jgi:hypothetical protein
VGVLLLLVIRLKRRGGRRGCAEKKRTIRYQTIMNYSIRFHVEIPIKPKNGITGADLEKTVIIPFLPVKGMRMCIARGDDYRVVEAVHWDISVDFDVYFSYDPQGKLTRLKKLGWREE